MRKKTVMIFLIIEPIRVCDTPHFISLFADDVLIFIKNLSKSLPHLMKIFDTFCKISGSKINWSKSALMPLGERSGQTPTFNFPTPIVTNFKYLCFYLSIFGCNNHKQL